MKFPTSETFSRDFLRRVRAANTRLLCLGIDCLVFWVEANAGQAPTVTIDPATQLTGIEYHFHDALCVDSYHRPSRRVYGQQCDYIRQPQPEWVHHNVLLPMGHHHRIWQYHPPRLRGGPERAD